MAEWALTKVVDYLTGASKALTQAWKSEEKARIYVTGVPDYILENDKERRKLMSKAQKLIENYIKLMAEAEKVRAEKIHIPPYTIKGVGVKTWIGAGIDRFIWIKPHPDEKGRVIVKFSELKDREGKMRYPDEKVGSPGTIEIVYEHPEEEKTESALISIFREYIHKKEMEKYKDRIIETLSYRYPNLARVIADVIKNRRNPIGKEKIAPIYGSPYALVGRELYPLGMELRYDYEQKEDGRDVIKIKARRGEESGIVLPLDVGHAVIVLENGKILHIDSNKGEVEKYTLIGWRISDKEIEKSKPMLVLIHGRNDSGFQEIERYDLRRELNWKRKAKRERSLFRWARRIAV